MAQEKRDQKTSQQEYGQFGADVYENAKKFNHQLAMIGPALLYTLKTSEKTISNSTIATGVGGLVLGAVGFFGNQYYRKRGDDSAYSFMGKLTGGIHFVAGFMLLSFKAYEIYADTGEPKPMLDVLNFADTVLTVTQGTLILVNSYLYSDGIPKTDPGAKPK